MDATTPEGKDLSKLLVGFLQRESGPDAFAVRPTRPRRPKDTPAPGSRA